MTRKMSGEIVYVSDDGLDGNLNIEKLLEKYEFYVLVTLSTA